MKSLRPGLGTGPRSIRLNRGELTRPKARLAMLGLAYRLTLASSATLLYMLCCLSAVAACAAVAATVADPGVKRRVTLIIIHGGLAILFGHNGVFVLYGFFCAPSAWDFL